MSRVEAPKKRLACFVALCALALSAACNKRNDSKATAAALPPAPKMVPVHMPDAVPAEHADDAAQLTPAAITVKSSGRLGERLEGDVYFFKLRNLRLCDASGKVAGVEVEIEAKTKLGVSPRDVVIGKGGITFAGALDLERKLPGCLPLLKVSVLKNGEFARGYVLFDLPRPPPSDLTLIYQPTRWGGAGYVNVALQAWPGPP